MLVSEWSRAHEVTVICQSNPKPGSRDDIEVLPSFDVNNPLSILHIINKIRRIDPDVVVFNQSIGLWGQKKLSNFIGMSLPLLTKKILRKPTFTILHNVYEAMEIDKIERVERSYLLDKGVVLATWLLLKGSDMVSVTLKEYRDTLNKKYEARNVIHVPHGMPVNNFSYETSKEEFRLLAFGHWSPNKDLPLLLKAYQQMEEEVKLTVCGSSHPDHPDYLENIKEDFDTSDVEFKGYIPEEKVKDVFSQADLAILPYKVSVGTSGVLNLSMGYGLPVLATQTKFLQNISEEEDAKLIFCDQNPKSMAETVNQVRKQPSRLKSLAENNHEVAKTKSITSTSQQILERLNEISD